MSLLVIVLFIAAVVVGIIAARFVYLKSKKVVPTILGTIVAIILCAVVALLIISATGGLVTTEECLESTIDLVPLYDDNYVAHSYMDTVPAYAYYYKAENGSLQFVQILETNAIICYIEDDSLPRIENYKSIERGTFPVQYEKIVKVYSKIYVPPNSL